MEGGGSKHLFFLGDFVDVEPGGGVVARLPRHRLLPRHGPQVPSLGDAGVRLGGIGGDDPELLREHVRV